MRQIDIPELIETQYKSYSMYVLESRSICNVVDGLKPVQRRALYSATKLCKNDYVKVTKLSGYTMQFHPHGDIAISDAICNMAQRFCAATNVNYFDGKGAFGSKISGPGNAIASPRYVAVKLSENFEKILYTDHELIEMQPSYDGCDSEPKEFLPLIPSILLNPISGIAVGFACDIFPRKIEDIIHCQLAYLEGKGFREPLPYFDGFNGDIKKIEDNVYEVRGKFTKNGRKLVITELPIGYNREKYVQILDNLEENNTITSYTDDCTEDFHFTINLKEDLTDEQIYEKFKLVLNLHENLTVIWFNGKVRKTTFTEIIKEFTDYRFKLFLKRYKTIFYINKGEFEYKKDLLNVMVKGLFKKFPEMSKEEIKDFLLKNGIMEKNISKIIQTPIYRFGKDEINTLKKELLELKKYIEDVVKLCKDEGLRKDKYKQELKEIKL